MSRIDGNAPEETGKKGRRQAPQSRKKKTTTAAGASKSRSKRKNVTLADIARRAKVSIAAVSFTMAERADIALSEVTRERIKQCAKELGYLPNRLGNGFLHNRSKLIGVLIMVDSYRPFLDCIAGIHESLAAADCFPLLMSSEWIAGHTKNGSAENGQYTDELTGLRRLLEYRVDGVLYFATHPAPAAACIKELTMRRVPTVIMGGVNPSKKSMDIVGGDNEKIGWMAAEHLLSAGCASFAFGTPTPSHPLDAVMRASFLKRLKKAGHSCEDFSLDSENPGDIVRMLALLVHPPAGIFCARDDIAALILRAAFTLGWSIPRDCALVAMGEAPLSRFNALPITTINRNSFAVGEAAAKLLLRRIGGLDDKPQHILIPPAFEVRTSSKSDVSWRMHTVPPCNRSIQEYSPTEASFIRIPGHDGAGVFDGDARAP